MGLSLKRRRFPRNAAPRFIAASPANAWCVESAINPYSILAYDPEYVVTEDGIVVTEDGIPIFLSDQNLTYAITGGTDASLFFLQPQVDNSQCFLKFNGGTPTASAPTDSNADSIYNVEITITDSLGQASTPFVLDLRVVHQATSDYVTANGTGGDMTIVNAVDTMVDSLKDNSLWNSLLFLYPFTGGTASAHKWNLKDARDLDAAFRLNFVGTWTHSATGADPGGSDSYANTFCVPSTAGFSSTGGAMGIYLRDNNSGAFCDLGCSDAAGKELSIYARYAGNTYMNYGSDSYAIGGAESDSRGLWTVGRISATQSNGWKNATPFTAQTQTPTIPNVALYLGARNQNGSVVQRSPNQMAFAFATTEVWTNAKQTTMNSIVSAFQTALSRVA